MKTRGDIHFGVQINWDKVSCSIGIGQYNSLLPNFLLLTNPGFDSLEHFLIFVERHGINVSNGLKTRPTNCIENLLVYFNARFRKVADFLMDSYYDSARFRSRVFKIANTFTMRLIGRV